MPSKGLCNLEPGPSARRWLLGDDAADRAWGRLKITSQFLAGYFLANEYVIRPTRLRKSRNVTTATKFFETQRLQALPPANMQRPTAQRDGGGKFEKGNLVNGNVWQRDKDQLTEGGERITQLTI